VSKRVPTSGGVRFLLGTRTADSVERSELADFSVQSAQSEQHFVDSYTGTPVSVIIFLSGLSGSKSLRHRIGKGSKPQSIVVSKCVPTSGGARFLLGAKKR